jgi:type IV secretory pathway TrbD component
MRSSMHMNAQTPAPRDYGLVIGLLAGACVGAGLKMWLDGLFLFGVGRAGADLIA